MIRKLQRKFVLITMLSVVGVLSLIITLINVMNYVNINREVDEITQMLADNNGRFPRPEHNMNRPAREPEMNMTEETPYETRYFSVQFSKRGRIIWTNTGNVAAIRTDEANDYAMKAVDKGNEKGYLDNYRYFIKNNKDGTLVVCVDCTNRLSAAEAFLKASIGIAVAGTVAVFLLVIIFSGKVMKPIAQSYEKQKEFITNSSHEIKTPLAVIMANTEVIEMTSGESEWTSGIKKQVARLTSLTRNMTELARMDEEGIKIDKTVFNMSDAVIDVLSGFKVVASQADIDFEMNIEDNLMYNGNEKEIRQLVSILMDNAIKYSTGEIKVELKKLKNRIKLRVYNTANNVNAKEVQHYFDRFYRADVSRSKEIEGFGIGLSIAGSIVELHNGKITAKTEDEKSIEFVVSL